MIAVWSRYEHYQYSELDSQYIPYFLLPTHCVPIQLYTLPRAACVYAVQLGSLKCMHFLIPPATSCYARLKSTIIIRTHASVYYVGLAPWAWFTLPAGCTYIIARCRFCGVTIQIRRFIGSLYSLSLHHV